MGRRGQRSEVTKKAESLAKCRVVLSDLLLVIVRLLLLLGPLYADSIFNVSVIVITPLSIITPTGYCSMTLLYKSFATRK